MNTPDEESNVDSSSKPQGGSWQFRFLLFVIGIGVLGLIARSLGLF